MFTKFVESCAQWTQELVGPAHVPDMNTIYERIISAGMSKLGTTLQCQPTFCGERISGFDKV